MERQIRDLDEGTLHRMSKSAQLSMGEDHARWGGSALVALDRGTHAYKIGFANQSYAQMQTSRLWSEEGKRRVEYMLDTVRYDAALEIIAVLNEED